MLNREESDKDERIQLLEAFKKSTPSNILAALGVSLARLAAEAKDEPDKRDAAYDIIQCSALCAQAGAILAKVGL